jgi:hypothetical protein
VKKLKLFSSLFIPLIIILYTCEYESNEDRDVARLEQMEKEILEIVNDLNCQDSTDCQFVGFGVKPCGGPWRYLIYSVTNVDNVLLNEKVKEYNEYNDMLNNRYGWVSDCSMAEPPVLGCIGGECINNI